MFFFLWHTYTNNYTSLAYIIIILFDIMIRVCGFNNVTRRAKQINYHQKAMSNQATKLLSRVNIINVCHKYGIFCHIFNVVILKLALVEFCFVTVNSNWIITSNIVLSVGNIYLHNAFKNNVISSSSTLNLKTWPIPN